jgi:hypothetical protein
MALSIFLVCFLLAATYFQAIQGLTSAVIMAVLTALCVGLAFGTYEAVAAATLISVTPDYAHAIAFFGMFLIPLIILRVALDSLVPRANLLPHLLDRAAAGVVGFFAAFLITGMLAIALQMVPWPGAIGYARFDKENPSEQNELLFRPDRVVAGFGSALSNGIFSGAQRFEQAHPDLVSELGWIQAGIPGMRRSAPADSVKFEALGPLPNVYDAEVSGSTGRGSTARSTYEPVEAKGGHKFLRVIIKVSGDKEKLADADDRKRYVPAAVRLVGETGDVPEIYSAIAIPDEADPNYLIRAWSERGKKQFVAGQSLNLPDNGMVEVAFEVREKFKPREVRFKWGGEAPVRATAAPPPPPQAAAPAATPPPNRGGGGRVSGVRFLSSHFGNDLPVTLTAYQGYDTENRGTALEQGHVEGNLADQGDQQRDQALKTFEVPAGKALLHLNVENLRAGSVLGKALNWSVQTVENYILEDDRGNRMTPVGKYAVATVGNTDYIEVQYFPSYVNSGGRLRPFSKIKSTHLRGDYQLVYLFLLDSGTKAMRFTPGGGKRSMDLSQDNLVAP